MKSIIKEVKKNKKGISVIVGYVLLIAFGIIMSVIVYAYLKSYVPKEPIACPDGVSISISEATCNASTEQLNITVKNNGNFNVNGFFIYGTTTPTQELAVQDLSQFLNNNTNSSEPSKYGSSVRFSNSHNSLSPGDERALNFTLNYTIYSVELMPSRFQGESNQEKLVSCTNAKIKQLLDC